MKKIFILSLSVFFALHTAQAQRKTRPLPNKPQAKPVQPEKPKEPELWSISWITVAEAPLDRVRWSTASYDSFRKLRGGTDVLQDIDAYLNKPIPQDYDEKSYKHEEGYRFYLTKYRDSFDELFNHLDLFIRAGKAAGFMYEARKELPIRFVRNNDGKLVFALTGVASDKVYNSVRLSVKQRAANILSSVIFPLAQSIDLFFKQTGIDYLALAVSYGSKNLSDEGAHPDGEVIVFVAPIEAIRQFGNHKITGDELLEKSEVYVGDKDSAPGVRKIKVVLE